MTNNYKKILNIVAKALTTGDIIPLNSFLFNGKSEKMVYQDISKRISRKTSDVILQVYQGVPYFKLPDNYLHLYSIYIEDIGEINLDDIITSSFGEEYKEFKNTKITEYLNLVDLENSIITINYDSIDLNGLSSLIDYYIKEEGNTNG